MKTKTKIIFSIAILVLYSMLAVFFHYTSDLGLIYTLVMPAIILFIALVHPFSKRKKVEKKS